MRELIDYAISRFEQYWVQFLVAAAFTIIGWVVGRRRARHGWQRREFFDRINISLNILRDGKLQIRTLIEKRCADVFLNQVAADTVIKLAQQTTAADPLLPIPKEDHWYYLNAILNELSEKFAAGVVRRDLGLPVHSETYLVCLTCEAAGVLRQKKVRAMVIRKAALENLPAEMPKLESPHHSTRWETLQKLAVAWKKTPERFLEMEICS